jgi:hypothetical protein
MVQIVNQNISIVYERREKETIRRYSHQNVIRLLSTREEGRVLESMCLNTEDVF